MLNLTNDSMDGLEALRFAQDNLPKLGRLTNIKNQLGDHRSPVVVTGENGSVTFHGLKWGKFQGHIEYTSLSLLFRSLGIENEFDDIEKRTGYFYANQDFNLWSVDLSVTLSKSWKIYDEGREAGCFLTKGCIPGTVVLNGVNLRCYFDLKTKDCVAFQPKSAEIVYNQNGCSNQKKSSFVSATGEVYEWNHCYDLHPHIDAWTVPSLFEGELPLQRSIIKNANDWLVLKIGNTFAAIKEDISIAYSNLVTLENFMDIYDNPLKHTIFVD